MATATDAFAGGITNATNTLTNAVTNAFSNAQNNAAALTSTSFVNLAPTEVLDGGVDLKSNHQIYQKVVTTIQLVHKHFLVYREVHWSILHY